LKEKRSMQLREKVARETAMLLYTSQENEYLQAKRRAAEVLGVRVLPSNFEVAKWLDRISDENEGIAKKKRLLQMRKDALRMMAVLKDFHPRLVGSVWRGTAHRNSDVDIEAFASNPQDVVTQLEKNSFTSERSEQVAITKKGEREISFHLYLTLPSGTEAEIVVRDPEKRNTPRRCEIFGDNLTGLSYIQLQRVLKKNPFQRFVPEHAI
jgi:predicted nucleotidyltransferase